MENSLTTSKSAPNKLSEKPSPKQTIMLALAEMGILRGGEWSKSALTIFAERLSREPVDLVLSVIETLANTPRRSGEPAIPEYAMITGLLRDKTHPQKHLRGIVRTLATAYGVTPDEALFKGYEDAAGHRTDADQTKAYLEIVKEDSYKRMPTPAQFRVACGVPKIYRDGSRPE